MSINRIGMFIGKGLALIALSFVSIAGQCVTSLGEMVPGPTGPVGPQGSQGEQGEPGADGALRVYGDGSAGDRVVSGDEDWNSGPNQPKNLQFKNLTIEDGATLTVPSGMTIRVQEDFVNHGMIVVLPAADGGFAGRVGPGSDDFSDQTIDPVVGIGTLAAQAGEIGDTSGAQLAGRGGIGLSEFETRQLLTVSTVAGGGGAVGGSDSDGGVTSNAGSKGGGALRIIAMGAIINSAGAEINADGEGGEGGGGGGGLVVLASMTSVENAGMVSATGGDGESGDSNEAASGGGGGGVVHMLAPEVSGNGGVDVSGGDGGAGGSTVSASTRFAGGGGGASGGDGGNGGTVPAGVNPAAGAAGDGEVGFDLVTELDPTSLL